MAKKKNLKKLKDGDAFIRESEQATGARDDLAEYLAEEFVRSAVSGENSEEEARDEVVDEELGGPFLEESAEEEFGRTQYMPGDDGVAADALPSALGSLAIAAPDEASADEGLSADDDGDEDDATPEPDAESASRIAPPKPAVSSNIAGLSVERGRHPRFARLPRLPR